MCFGPGRVDVEYKTKKKTLSCLSTETHFLSCQEVQMNSRSLCYWLIQGCDQEQQEKRLFKKEKKRNPCRLTEKSNTETEVSFLYLRNSNPWHIYTHHKRWKGRGSCTRRHRAGTINKRGKQEGYSGALQALAVLWAAAAGAGSGGEGRNAADWPSWHWGNVWKMDDAQHSGLSPQSVVAVAQRNYKYMHFR